MASQNQDSQYFFSRSYVGSARLTLQHWLWMHRIRYILHPSIRLSSSASHPLKIADIGTGNAIWLIELASSPHLPPGALLDGFDISPDQYPAQKWLPENISLACLDAMGEGDHVVPPELVGKYDVVHIRTFAFVVKRNDPLPLLRNLARMLSMRCSFSLSVLLSFWFSHTRDGIVNFAEGRVSGLLDLCPYAFVFPYHLEISFFFNKDVCFSLSLLLTRGIIEPNGHLQWDEMDPSTLATNPSSSSKPTTTTASDLFLQKWKSHCAQSGIIWE